jgi:gas vesicle protein
MEKNKQLLAAFAAGAALAGAAAYVLSSRKGKEATQQLKSKGEKMLSDAENIINEAKSRLDHLKSGFMGEKRTNGKVPEDIVM